MSNTVTFWVIRASRDHVNRYNSQLVKFERSRPNEFLKGWYVAKKFTKDKFSQAKFFDSRSKASSYLKVASSISTHYDQDPVTGNRLDIMDYFEIIPIEVQEPK